MSFPASFPGMSLSSSFQTFHGMFQGKFVTSTQFSCCSVLLHYQSLLDSSISNVTQLFAQFIAMSAASVYQAIYSHLFCSINLVIFIVKTTVASLNSSFCLLTPVETLSPLTSK